MSFGIRVDLLRPLYHKFPIRAQMFPAVFSQDLGRSFSKHSEKLQENIWNVVASPKVETCNKHFLNQRCIQYESIHLMEVGLFSPGGVNINWFLPWPGEALVAVSA